MTSEVNLRWCDMVLPADWTSCQSHPVVLLCFVGVERTSLEVPTYLGLQKRIDTPSDNQRADKHRERWWWLGSIRSHQDLKSQCHPIFFRFPLLTKKHVFSGNSSLECEHTSELSSKRFCKPVENSSLGSFAISWLVNPHRGPHYCWLYHVKFGSTIYPYRLQHVAFGVNIKPGQIQRRNRIFGRLNRQLLFHSRRFFRCWAWRHNLSRSRGQRCTTSPTGVLHPKVLKLDAPRCTNMKYHKGYEHLIHKSQLFRCYLVREYQGFDLSLDVTSSVNTSGRLARKW